MGVKENERDIGIVDRVSTDPLKTHTFHANSQSQHQHHYIETSFPKHGAPSFAHYRQYGAELQQTHLDDCVKAAITNGDREQAHRSLRHGSAAT